MKLTKDTIRALRSFSTETLLREIERRGECPAVALRTALSNERKRLLSESSGWNREKRKALDRLQKAEKGSLKQCRSAFEYHDFSDKVLRRTFAAGIIQLILVRFSGSGNQRTWHWKLSAPSESHNTKPAD